MHECNRLNQISGWPQFQVHFYDHIKFLAHERSNLAIVQLKKECVLRVPRDIESFAFRNKMDLTKHQHNKNMQNATQSQQYIMDLIDQKFEKLKDTIYKLGIQPTQFRNMVEGQALFEWSSEVALSLSMRFCSWVVQEDAAGEDNATVDGKSQRHLSFHFGKDLEIDDEKYKIGKLDKDLGVDEIPEVLLDMDSEEPSLLTNGIGLMEI